MPFDYFNSDQITPLIISGILLFVSIVLFRRHKKLSLLLLFIGTIAIGYFIANLDHFLILWDEQYHALVAKNLSNNPLRPLLFADPLLNFNYKDWTENHVWLHKQPLFLWQIALSLKVFGTTELAVRIPSILMHAIMPLFIYRIGKISINENAAYNAALLFSVAYFPLELVTGRYSTDHNDIAFLFYITGSFWAWFEYEKSQKKYWLLLIGMFSGCAVLVKWLMGLLVYIIWVITKLLTDKKGRLNIKSYLPLLYSGLISLLIFLPWQIYISIKYPLESSYEYKMISSHFFKAIEGHTESIWYYFTDGLEIMYGSGDLVPFILLLGIILLLIKIPNKIYKVAIASTILFVYIFYTLAATKMVAFTIIVLPFVYLGLGYLIDSLNSLFGKKVDNKFLTQTFSIIILRVISFTALNLTKIQGNHTAWKAHDNHNRFSEQVEMALIQSLKDNLNGEEYVVFNASITLNGHIPIMFYTDYIAYNFIPSRNQIEKIRQNNKKIAILDLGNLPEYIVQDKSIKIVKVKL